MRRKTMSAAKADRLLRTEHSTKIIKCSKCERMVKVDLTTESVICHLCSCALAPLEKKTVAEKSNRPAGWRFMKEFIDADGTVYHIGVEVPELKGTLTPTDVDALKAAQKAKRKEKKSHKADREQKKEEKLIREFEKKKLEKKKLEQKKEDDALKNKFIGEE